MLAPLDLLLALKLLAMEQRGELSPDSPAPSRGGRRAPGSLTYGRSGEELGISPSMAFRAAESCRRSGLIGPNLSVRRGALHRVILASPHLYPARLGDPASGIPTGFAGPILRDSFLPNAPDKPVWPHAAGSESGRALEALHKAAPSAALKDSCLYDLLSLVDALRVGRARERGMAQARIKEMLETPLANHV
jgi:hypothetical protein